MTRRIRLRSLFLGILSTIGFAGSSGFVAGCSSSPLGGSAQGNGAIEESTNDLTLADVASRVLGFESISDWSLVQGSIAAPTLVSDKTQGAWSFQVPAQGYVVIQSAKLANSAVGSGSTFSCDLKLPTAQANPSWLGSLSVVRTSAILPSPNRIRKCPI